MSRSGDPQKYNPKDVFNRVFDEDDRFLYVKDQDAIDEAEGNVSGRSHVRRLGENVDVISVKIKDKDLMYRAKEDIEKLMRKRRDVDIGEEDFSLETPDTMLSTVNSILGGVRAFIIIIASISILVGALGIVNTMTTSILERRKEIGIMKAIGAKNSQVFMQFFFESGMLGFIGGLVGVIFGTLISVVGIVGINNFIGAELSPVIDFVLIGGALAGSFIIGAVAGIVPAMSAANQNPVEALRG